MPSMLSGSRLTELEGLENESVTSCANWKLEGRLSLSLSLSDSGLEIEVKPFGSQAKLSSI